MATAASNKKQKKKWGEPQELTLGAIMAPFLDMAFQLLFFFVINYHPSALEGHIDGKLLPPEEIAIQDPTKKKEEVTSTELDPEVKTEISLQLKTTQPGVSEGTFQEGQLTRMEIKTPESPSFTPLADAADTLEGAMAKLTSRLEEIKKSHKDEKLVVKLQPDANLKHMYVVTVWNVCKAALGKNDQVNFVAPPGQLK